MAADAPEEGTPLEAGLLLLEAKVVAVLVQVFLAVPEVDGKYLVLLLAETDDEVAGVDVVEDESLGVDPLQGTRLQQRRPQQLRRRSRLEAGQDICHRLRELPEIPGRGRQPLWLRARADQLQVESPLQEHQQPH